MRITRSFLLLVTAGVLAWSCNPNELSDSPTAVSPDGKNSVTVSVNAEGQLQYTVLREGDTLIAPSTLGFMFKDAPELSKGLEVTKRYQMSNKGKWEMPWGEQKYVEDNYQELFVAAKETGEAGRTIHLRFKVYDDGIGFRYEFPKQPGWEEATILEENTHFQLTEDYTTWWIPGDWDIYEHLYTTSPISKINAISKQNHPNLAATYIPQNAVNTPVTMRGESGLHLSFHEANLTDYAGMTLKVDTTTLTLSSGLVQSERNGYAVKRRLPFETPWRMIQIADKATDLIKSRLILNLNEPNKLGDVSWIKPTKYVGIWWEMHLAKSSWDVASGKHGATTENAKKHIDFAAQNGIGAVLVEGWNTGWERWIGFPDREGVFDFVTPYSDYDLESVVAYGKEKGVDIMMHHETSAAPRTYEQQMDTAYALMQRLEIGAVKTGYVGPLIPEGEYHHGQWMVNHYRKAITEAAKHNIAINAHEPIKATGIRRTYPNAISREGLRGQEFNAFGAEGGNPPEHLPIVAFTRMLAGPIDFTPGVFHQKLTPYKDKNQVSTTLAQQLALYVVIYSPIQMACDLLVYYEDHPAFQFIRDVAVDWDDTRVLNGEVGEYVSIARREKGSDNWFLGAITNENAREIPITLNFLKGETTFIMTQYVDAEDAHWDDNPGAYKINTMEVKKGDEISLKLAAGGGAAISFFPKK
ncbi:MAG: glycoside hydrolase family 97 protein [Bacteroidota bacterium]